MRARPRHHEGGRIVKERPILFSGEMVRAILAGTKTQTRRVVKPRPQMVTQHRATQWEGDPAVLLGLLGQAGRKCPYGQTGDRLWVREAFAIVPRTAYAHSEGVQQTLRPDDPYNHDAAIYREGWTRSRGGFRWRPSIHMPRWASRITLEVTGVRVERLQEISDEDSLAEGIYPTSTGLYPGSPRAAYSRLWESINGPGSWDANPWVWCVEFKRVEAS